MANSASPLAIAPAFHRQFIVTPLTVWIEMPVRDPCRPCVSLGVVSPCSCGRFLLRLRPSLLILLRTNGGDSLKSLFAIISRHVPILEKRFYQLNEDFGFVWLNVDDQVHVLFHMRAD